MKRKHSRKTLYLLLAAVFIIAGSAWLLRHAQQDKGTFTATIIETPQSGGRLGAGYTLEGKNGQTYQIYAMYGGPAGYDGKLDCVKLPGNLETGDKVRFRLPANPSLTGDGVQGFAICYPAGQNQGYYLRKI